MTTTIKYAVTEIMKSGKQVIRTSLEPTKEEALELMTECWGNPPHVGIEVRPIECAEDGTPMGILAAEK